MAATFTLKRRCAHRCDSRFTNDPQAGAFCGVQVFGQETTVDWSIIGDRKELDIRGAHLAPYSYEIATDLFERGLVTSKGIVTHSYSLDDWEKAFELADSTNSIKVILVP